MANLLKMPQALQDIEIFGVFSDFCEDQADTQWVDTITDSGTVAMGDAKGGVAVLTPSDCTVVDNDEAYLASPNEVFLITAGKPIYGEARMKFSEVTSNKLNFCFGFQNAVGANSLIDNGAGLKVSGDCLAIYKVDGETVLRCVSVVAGGTASVNTTSFTPTAGTYYTYGIEVIDRDPVYQTVVFTVDGTRLKDATTGLDITHTIPVASSTEMQCFVGAKLGASTNNDTLSVDYAGGWQAR